MTRRIVIFCAFAVVMTATGEMLMMPDAETHPIFVISCGWLIGLLGVWMPFIELNTRSGHFAFAFYINLAAGMVTTLLAHYQISLLLIVVVTVVSALGSTLYAAYVSREKTPHA